MAERPTLAEALERIMRVYGANFFVCRPARVNSYDASTQTVNCTPTLRRTKETPDGNEVREPALIEDVPVCFPRGGGYFVSFPIKAGDYVLLVFADRALDLWLENGGIVDPVLLRRHSVKDAIAIPGVYPAPDALSDASGSDMVLGKDGGSQITINDAGDVSIGSGSGNTDHLARGDYVEELRDAISGWSPTANDGGAALKTALTAWLTKTGAAVRTTKTQAD